MERRPIQLLDPHWWFTDIGTAAGAPPLARLIVLPQPKKAGSSDAPELLSSNALGWVMMDFTWWSPPATFRHGQEKLSD